MLPVMPEFTADMARRGTSCCSARQCIRRRTENSTTFETVFNSVDDRPQTDISRVRRKWVMYVEARPVNTCKSRLYMEYFASDRRQERPFQQISAMLYYTVRRKRLIFQCVINAARHIGLVAEANYYQPDKQLNSSRNLKILCIRMGKHL